MRLLVAYGSKRGSTQEVAETIADTMKSAGREVELRRAVEIEDLTPYEGVVLGGSLYFGRWHEDAARFMSKNRRELSKTKRCSKFRRSNRARSPSSEA